MLFNPRNMHLRMFLVTSVQLNVNLIKKKKTENVKQQVLSAMKFLYRFWSFVFHFEAIMQRWY